MKRIEEDKKMKKVIKTILYDEIVLRGNGYSPYLDVMGVYVEREDGWDDGQKVRVTIEAIE